jgi:hypothetical protein
MVIACYRENELENRCPWQKRAILPSLEERYGLSLAGKDAIRWAEPPCDRVVNGVKKLKPHKIPRLYEMKVSGAIARAEKTVQTAQDRVREAKKIIEVMQETVEKIRRTRRASSR